MFQRPVDPYPRQGPRSALPRLVVLLASFLTFVLLLPNPAFAHGELKGASPGDGDILSTAPRELRLSFTEAPELAVTRLSLTGPGGPVALAPLAVDPDSATVLIEGIEGPLVAGSYTVNWQVVSADGHPVRGEYSFVIEPGAQGLTTAEPSAAAPSSAAPATPEQDLSTESSGSGTLLWLIGAIVLGVIGVVGFQLFGRRPLRDDAGEHV